MELSAYILECLRKESQVVVPGLGTFFVDRAPAEFGAGNKSIHPPAEQICFTQDFELKNQNFLNAEKDIYGNLQDLEMQIAAWRQYLSEPKNFEINGVGSFIAERDGMVFKGKKLTARQFYGLEEIHLDEQPTVVNQDFSIGNHKLWLYVTILCALLALAASLSPQSFFGEKSFQTVPKSSAEGLHR